MNHTPQAADAQHKERAYRGLAKHYAQLPHGAASGDGWLAVHAQLAADLAAAVVVGAPNPTRVGPDGRSALAVTLLDNADLLERATARTVVTDLRNRIEHGLDEAYRSAWRARLASPAYLPEETPTADLAQMLRDQRLGGMSPAMFADAQFAHADQQMAAARDLLARGKTWPAVEAGYAADLAAFEGWLVARSAAAGDDDLVMTELRWTLAVAALETLEGLPEDLEPASNIVRSRLAWAVGPSDAYDLAHHLPSLR